MATQFDDASLRHPFSLEFFQRLIRIYNDKAKDQPAIWNSAVP
jgi:hypothetical protein